MGSLLSPFNLKEASDKGTLYPPYIYIICDEVLSDLINKAPQDGSIKGVSIASNAPAVSHLLYADDSILFSRVRIAEATIIVSILQSYQEASGQTINLDKSEMVFSPNISQDFKKSFQDHLPVKHQ